MMLMASLVTLVTFDVSIGLFYFFSFFSNQVANMLAAAKCFNPDHPFNVLHHHVLIVCLSRYATCIVIHCSSLDVRMRQNRFYNLYI